MCKLTKTLFQYEFIEFAFSPVMTRRRFLFAYNTFVYYTIKNQKNSFYIVLHGIKPWKFLKITCPKKTFKDLVEFLIENNFSFLDKQKMEKRLQKILNLKKLRNI